MTQARHWNTIRPDIESMLWIAATRYYLGRMTADVGEFCAHLIGAWSRLDDHTRDVIRRSVESEFERDDRARQLSADPSATLHHGRCLPLGEDYDRREWEKIRELWS